MHRIGLIGENSIEYVDKLLDIWNRGDCAVLIDWRIPCQTAIAMMHEANVSVCYVEDKWLSDFLFYVSCDLKFIGFHRKSNSAELMPKAIYQKFIENYSYDEAIVIYSSGTTGQAKGIILSHYAINTNADAIIDYMQLAKNDCLYIAKTISHSSTMTGELLVALKTGIRLVLAPTIVPPRFVFHNIDKFDVTIICLNPMLLRMYIEAWPNSSYNLETLKNIYVSGEVLNEELCCKAREIFKGINIYNVYGLSEAGPRVTAQKIGCCTSNSVGTPLKGIEVAVINEWGQIAKNDEYGIIHVNTPSRFNGYITGNKKLQSHYRGWLNTGDVGKKNENGEFYIIDRIDNIITIDSHKIYPNDIARRILRFADITECVVVKTYFNEQEFLGCLYVGPSEIGNKIRENLKQVLTTYELPRVFTRSEYIPKTLGGKPCFNEIKTLIEQDIILRKGLRYGKTEI